MAQVIKFTVAPRLPERMAALLEVANNMWWCWDHDAIELFMRVDRDLWVSTNQNPRRLLGEISQLRLEELANDESFLAHLQRVRAKLQRYLDDNSWAARNPEADPSMLVAYMSAEFGVHESVKVYSGGLGVLAGDHLKAASDLGVPLVGIGLLYREGYFSQYLNSDGFQQETYPRNDFYNMPLTHALDSKGVPVVVDVEFPGRNVKANVWICQIGRVPLYLLDTDHDGNSPEDRTITAKLYGGDHDTRVRQEIMLGMGGVMAMNALGLKPTIYHMNEGHAAFMALQRIKELVLHQQLTFDQAIETVKAGSVFTTHTPVPAGNDMFDAGLINNYFKKYCKDVGIGFDHLLELGRQNPADTHEPFCMTVLALRMSSGANGVSKLHGEVSRDMWNLTWKGVPTNEVPITSITNGIHTRSWISPDLADLYDRYLGPGWVDSPDDQSIWKRIDEVPDTELWRTHGRRRERLVSFARRRLYKQHEVRGATATELRTCMEVLDPEVLTIGFARRFATYKRGSLILRDIERLRKMLLHPLTPVQFIIAGKAHPADTAGKQIIREFFQFAQGHDVRRRILFIEDYDVNVARYMVQGVDCWLNTPRRPMEASGTSGMKAAANGALNISVPDGWWCEAEHLGANGWSIGRGETYASADEQDLVESQALYEILEQEVIPLFYQHGRDGFPREWVSRMKSAIRTIGPVFNTYRMVQEYADRFYIPATSRRNALIKSDRSRALALADWKRKLRSAWSGVSVLNVEAAPTEGLLVGERLPVRAEVALGELSHTDVTVEIYYGEVSPRGQVPDGHPVEMEFTSAREGNICCFEGAITCKTTGQQGLTVRVIPHHADLAQKHETTLIAWAGEQPGRG